MLRPALIKSTKENKLARPGPAPPDELKAIAGLARDMRIAQSIPVIVGPPDKAGLHPLIAGGRRLAAAHMIESEDESSFYLECIVRPQGRNQLFDAIRENIKRRGLTALQFAHMCSELRIEFGWKGTAEVAKYLGVSRAQVSQHDKLLKRPDGMTEVAYQELLGLVQAGRAGAETAFYTLTHVEPAAAGQVLERAQELAEADEAKKSAVTHVEPEPARPAKREAAQRADKTESEPAKNDFAEIPCAKDVFDALNASYSADLIPRGKIRKPVVLDAYTTPYVCTSSCTSSGGLTCECYEVYPPAEFDESVTTYQVRVEHGDLSRKDPKGFYHGIAVKSGKQVYVLCGPPVIYRPEETEETAAKATTEPVAPKPKARVEKKHVRQAAQESRAIKAQTQRTVPELRTLFEKLRVASYPDIMRGFISVLTGQWWAGAAGDDQVLARWTQIALIVEEQQALRKFDRKLKIKPRKKRVA